jgi:hypothetical protein
VLAGEVEVTSIVRMKIAVDLFYEMLMRSKIRKWEMRPAHKAGSQTVVCDVGGYDTDSPIG